MDINFAGKCRRHSPTGTMGPVNGHVLSPVRHAAVAATLCAMFAASAPAAAQMCVTPVPLTSKPLVDTTCGGEQVSAFLCAESTANPGPNYVIEFVLNNPAGHLMISGTPSFTPRMYLSSANESCTSATCVGVGEPGVPMSFDGLPAGAYRLIIAAQPDDPPNTCGTFMLVGDDAFYAGGSDIIFANGFD
jgi:hypothetical protein